jgi:alcohol dehydrogenase class IV
VAAPETAFQVPATIAVGRGVSRSLGERVAALGARRALLVTDAYMVTSGLAARLGALLEDAGVATTVYDGVQPDPTDENVRDGLVAFRTAEAQVVVAVGGGSALDAAKMVAVGSANPGPIRDYMGYHRIPRAGAPLIAVPTTAGTGSEVTRVTVITDTERETKMMILDGHLVPTVALVDPELSATMPKPLTAHVGVDTLTHGIEAYVSALSSPMTDPLARSCVALVGEHLRRAWRVGDDLEARGGMAVAACHGGMAFANSSVCLVHGMSRPLGAVFHIPHGLSNAVLLPTVTAFSLSGAPQRYAQAARDLGVAEEGHGDSEANDRLLDGLNQLNEELEIPRLGELLDIDYEEFDRRLPKMAADALESGSPGRNPVVPDESDIVDLYRRAW